MPKIDYSKLLGRIKEKGYTQKSISEMISLSESHFCRKLSGEFSFRQSEIHRICEILDIPAQEIGDYFFTPEVEKTQL